MRLLVCLLVSGILLLAGGDVARAGGWTDTPPQVVVNEGVAYSSQTYCPTFSQMITIFGAGEHSACVFVGNRLSFANYRTAGGSRVAIKFPYHNQYHQLLGVCEQYWGCVYSDEGDVLIEQRLINGKVAPVIYEKVRTRLQVRVPFSYGFDTSGMKVPFQNVAVPTFALSANGRWLAGEAKGRGIDLVNVETGGVQTVSVTGNLYGRGFDPQMELAVSNDGRSVVAVGLNVGVRLFDVTPGCLQLEKCHSTEAGVGRMIASFRSAHRPRFDDRGQLLKMVLVSRTVSSRVAVLGKGEAPNRIEYIALGDSFTSGEGETNVRYYEPLTHSEENSCHVSQRSYPYLLGILSAQNVACAGATIGDVLIKVKYPSKSTDLLKLVPGTKPQAAFIDYAQPELVTIGIGGNDAGLMAKLGSCAMPGTCHWVRQGGLRATAQEIADLFDRLVEMYQALISRAPATRFIAVGYPLPTIEGEECDLLTGVLLSAQERRFMNETIRYLNRVIDAAATKVGIGFIDGEWAYGLHALCSRSASLAMNTLRFGDDIAPIQSLPAVRIISSASFHPTPFGHGLFADMIKGRYGDIRTYRWCEGDRIVCPQEVGIPEPSDFWPPNDTGGTYRYAHLLTGPVLAGRTIRVESPDWFQANDRVRATLWSRPVDLGWTFTDHTGSTTATLEIPIGINEGYHTLMLTGISHEGRPITLYQEIVVQQSVSPPQAAGRQTGKTPVRQGEHSAGRESFADTSLRGVARDQRNDNALGWATNRVGAEKHSGWWMLAMAPFVPMLYIAIKKRQIAYNDTMANIRTIVKKLIPVTLFKKIEPVGHLFESVLMNIRYGFPGRKLRIIGVTGTNGKTTTSFMIHRLLHESGIKTALLTTVANGVGDDIVPQAEHITTAQAGVLQRRLRDYVRQGVEWVVVETSSHALAQNRVWGLPYEIAVMTNITHEHLDYHGTFERYVEAKRKLFKIANRNGLRFGVVNAQDPSAVKFVRTVANHTTYGIGEGELRAEKVKLSADGSRYVATVDDDRYDMTVNIPGEFNVSNSLAAIAVGRKLGLSKRQIEKGIAALRSVEGRMNVIDEGQPFKVIVDFASTPDAFERLFESVRPLTKGKLIAVFGSAGRRDEAKRPVQGEIAGRSADIVVLTEEDDRDVDGNQILQEIAEGAKKAKKKVGKDLFLILNREEAIGFAMTQATSKDDVVVLLGKGHEQTIERADGEYPWNEADVARAALQALKDSNR